MIDPPRLRDGRAEAPPELAELFRAAEKPEPLTPATDARLLARITAVGGAPAASLAKGWLMAGAAVVVTGAAALVVLRAQSPGPAANRPPQVAAAAASASPPALAPSVVAPVPPAPAVEPESRVGSKRGASTKAGQPAAADASSSSEDSLAGEALLLNRAHAAMASDPRTAYAVASEHARRYPRGQLAAERELISIQALVKLGRVGEAEARGRALRKSAPSSIYGERLDTILKGK